MEDILHVERVLQYSGVLCCTWASSCNIRGRYVARGTRLATFGGAMLHVGLVLQHSVTLIVTSHQTCQQRHSYCHFLPNVSTTISQQHHNYALPYTSFTTSPDFLPRYSILINIYIKKDLFIWICKRKGPFSY